MAIFKRPGFPHWYIGFTAPNGKRIRRSSRTEDKQAAKQLDAKLQAELWAQQNLNKKPSRFWQEAVIKWIHEQTGIKTTLENDKYHLRWLSEHLDNITLDQITKTVINDLIDERKKAGKKGKPVSNSTINRMLEIVRAILRRAKIEWEWIDTVPEFKMLKEPEGRDRWITQEQALVLINELPDHQKDITIFALATGLRKSNVLGIQWDKIDLERRHAYVRAINSKSDKAIPVPLNAIAMEILEKRWLAEDRHPIWVFTYQGNRIKQVNTKAWRNALKRAKIDDFRWHDLRHTWSSWHAQSGTTLQSLQQLGGWSKIDMVLRYAHLSADHLKQDAERIADPKMTQLVKSWGGGDGETA